MSEDTIKPTDAVIEDALRFYWRVLLGHVDEMENLYRTGEMIPKVKPDPQKVSAAIDLLKKELFGMEPGEFFALGDPLAPEAARKAFNAMRRLQESGAGLQYGSNGSKPTPFASAAGFSIDPVKREKIKNKIKALRQYQQMDKTEFAKIIGSTRDAVNEWERGRRVPGDTNRSAIISNFDLPADFFEADYPNGEYPFGTRIQRKSIPPFKMETICVNDSNNGKKRRSGNGKLLRVLKLLGFKGNYDAATAKAALAEASAMVGTPIDKAIFDEYCLKDQPGTEVGKKYGKPHYQLSVDLERQARRIKQNRTAMKLVANALKGLPEKGEQVPKDINGILLNCGYEDKEAAQMTKALAAFNINSMDELLQAVTDGDLEAIPGFSQGGAEAIRAAMERITT